MEDDRQRERERLWNRTQPRLARSTSSLSLRSPNDPHQSNSYLNRPDSAQSFTTPPRRHMSWQSGSAHSSRPHSPASSIASSEREPHSEPRNPVVHERERNWGSAHPKWEYQEPPRSISPSPRSLHTASRSHSRLSNGSPSQSQLSEKRTITTRNRTVSLGNHPARPRSPLVRLSEQSKIPRPASPSSSVVDDSEGSPRPSPYGSRFGWSFPKNRGSLPPLEYEDSPHKQVATPPGSRPSSRLSTTPSRIPVRSPRKDDSLPSARAAVSTGRNLEESIHEEDLEGSYVDIPRASNVIAPRIRVEPIDLMHAETEDLVPTDIESGE